MKGTTKLIILSIFTALLLFSTAYATHFTGGVEVRINNGSANALGGTSAEKLVKDSKGVFHLVYEDSSQDLVYYNSTNGGATWNLDPTTIHTGTLDDTTLGILSNDTLHALTRDGSSVDDVLWSQKPPGSAWLPKQVLYDNTEFTATGFNQPRLAIDSNDVLHYCTVTSRFNSSTVNNLLVYGNWSASQGWFYDGTVRNATGVIFNGTFVNSSNVDNVNICDIEVDTSNNVYIIGTGTDQNDLDIWSSRNNFTQRVSLDTAVLTTTQDVAITIDTKDNIYVAYSDDNPIDFLVVLNNTANNWNGTWTSNFINAVRAPTDISVKTSLNGDVFVTYANTSNVASNFTVLLANRSTTSGTNWTNGTVLAGNSTTTGWANNPRPFMRGSMFPAFNRINTSVEYVYWNDTDNSVYFGNFSIPCSEANCPTVRWYNSTWQFRQKITFNSSRIAENNLTNFPVLINISSTNLSTYARADGNDIVFTLSNGTTKLDHEIENYTAGNLVAWVRIPVLSNTTNTSIFMYYNNSAIAANQQNRTGTWNESWLGVWHMHEGAGTRANDSTRYNNNGTISGGERWNATGSANTIIDGALDFDGLDDDVNVPDDNTLDFATSGSLAISAWIRPDTVTTAKQAIVEKSNGASVGWRFITSDTDGDRLKFISGSQFAEGVQSNDNVLTAGVWQHVAVSLNSTASFYVNGTGQGGGNPSSNSMSTTVALIIGEKSFGTSSVNNFNGMITEVRLHNGTLSSGWIKTEYNNQFEPFTFHMLGETNAVPNTCAPQTTLWYDTAWTYRINITFNSSQIAENGLTDFPALINFSSSNLSTYARADGNDIVFTDANGTTRLDYEIENYTAGNLVAWVRIPKLLNTSNTCIFMYYGNTAATSQQNRTGVWNESWVGVWHLHEGAGTTANDSTRYNNNGTTSGGPTWNTTAQIDGGMNFDAVDDLINLSSPATLDNVNTLTYTAWIYAKGYGEGGLGTIYTKDAIKELRMDIDDGFGVRIPRATTAAAAFASLASLTLNKWQFVATTYASGGTGPRLYVSAVEVSTYNLRQDGSGAITDDAAGNGYIGNIAGASRTFNGTIGEVRVYNGTLSSAWMKTEYNNQFQPFTFHMLGETNAVPNTCIPPANTNWTIEASDNCTVSGRSINVTNVFIQGRAGTVIFRQTNVTATDCRIQPSVGALIMLAIEPTVNWGNGC